MNPLERLCTAPEGFGIVPLDDVDARETLHCRRGPFGIFVEAKVALEGGN